MDRDFQALRVNKGGVNVFEPQDSPVVCFEPGDAPDIHGAHAPAMRDVNFGAFPPNSLCVYAPLYTPLCARSLAATPSLTCL